MAKKGIFADILSGLRDVAGLTQQELADRSGVALSTIRNYEQGWREPNWRALIMLARGLGKSLAAFDLPPGADLSSDEEAEEVGQEEPPRAKGSKRQGRPGKEAEKEKKEEPAPSSTTKKGRRKN